MATLAALWPLILLGTLPVIPPLLGMLFGAIADRVAALRERSSRTVSAPKVAWHHLTEQQDGIR